MNYCKRGFVCEEQFTHFSHIKYWAQAQELCCLHYGNQRAVISFSLFLCLDLQIQQFLLLPDSPSYD